MAEATLLQKAYLHIHAGEIQPAVELLHALVSEDARNVEAWEAYMQLCGTCDELDRLCERALQVAGFSRLDRESILDYYYFLRQRLSTLDEAGRVRPPIQIPGPDAPASSDGIEIEHGLAAFLGRAIVVPYLVLLVIGFSLLASGETFGYWILMMFALSIIVELWNAYFPSGRNVRQISDDESDLVGRRQEEVRYRPEMIH